LGGRMDYLLEGNLGGGRQIKNLIHNKISFSNKLKDSLTIRIKKDKAND
jgi:hypothetical protein